MFLISASEYAMAVTRAASGIECRSSKRDDSAVIVARHVAGNTCPRCENTFTSANPANYCHYAPAQARVTSDGIWFGSVACRACNMRDEASRNILGLSPNEAFPYAYVHAYFHVPARFNGRSEIIRMANEIQCSVPKATDSEIMSSALHDLERVGLV